MSEEKVSRRGYMKYVGGVIVVAVVAAAGYGIYEATKPAPTPTARLPIKIVYLLNETTDDMSWDLYYVTDAKSVQARYGDKVDVSWQLLIPFPDMEKVARDYAGKGYQFLHGCGVQWTDPMLAVNKEFPDTQFTFTCATKHDFNATSVVWREEEMGFLNAVMAGLMGCKKMGIIGASNVPCANSFGNGAIEGIRYVKETWGNEMEYMTGYAGGWADPVLGKNIAVSMIKAGCDFLAHTTAQTGLGVFEAAKEYKVYTMGMYRDQTDASGVGEYCLGSILYHNELAMDVLVPNLIAGNPPLGQEIPADFNHGYFEWKLTSKLVPKDVADKVAEVVKGITDRTIGVPRSEKPFKE